MRRILPLLLISALFAPVAASAQGLAIAGHAGTLGVGGTVVLGLSPRLNVRGTFGVVPTEPEFTVDNVDFTVDFPTFLRGTVDFYPTGFFYLSAGGLFVSDGGDIKVIGEFSGTQDFGGTTYAAADVGTLTGSFSLNNAMPYLGIGFGNPVGRRIGLSLDVGVGFGGVPTVDVGATGLIANDPTFTNDLNTRESEFEQDIPELLQYYPVVSLAVSIGLSG